MCNCPVVPLICLASILMVSINEESWDLPICLSFSMPVFVFKVATARMILLLSSMLSLYSCIPHNFSSQLDQDDQPSSKLSCVILLLSLDVTSPPVCSFTLLSFVPCPPPLSSVQQLPLVMASVLGAAMTAVIIPLQYCP